MALVVSNFRKLYIKERKMGLIPGVKLPGVDDLMEKATSTLTGALAQALPFGEELQGLLDSPIGKIALSAATGGVSGAGIDPLKLLGGGLPKIV
jgi:hypothetical protein